MLPIHDVCLTKAATNGEPSVPARLRRCPDQAPIVEPPGLRQKTSQIFFDHAATSFLETLGRLKSAKPVSLGSTVAVKVTWSPVLASNDSGMVP